MPASKATESRHKILAATLIALAAEAAAVNAQEENSPLELSPITVEAEKFPSEGNETAATVTVIDDARIDRELARSLEDLVRYEPGIDVPYQGSRFGSSGIVIRGIGGNRVRMEVDGVPISDAFSIDDFSNASRDFIDVDSLKQVEIVRGPSSALFGSSAVGGVVSFVTKDPDDYVAGEGFYTNAKAGYYGSDDSYVGNATVAGQSAQWGGMVQATWRQGHERQDIDAETDVVSLQGVQDFSASFGFPYIITTERVLADETRKRSRFNVGLLFDMEF